MMDLDRIPPLADQAGPPEPGSEPPGWDWEWFTYLQRAADLADLDLEPVPVHDDDGCSCLTAR